MMGRLTCVNESRARREAEDRTFAPSQASPSYLYMSSSSSKSIPLHHSHDVRSFPHIPNEFRSQSSQHHRASSSLTEAPPFQDRAHSSFQVSSPASEIKHNRHRAPSPSVKLPPIHSTKTTPITAMPPLSNTSCIHTEEEESSKKQYPAFLDFKTAYENMMIGYFISQNVKSESPRDGLPAVEESHLNQEQRGAFNFNTNAYRSHSERNVFTFPTMDNSYNEPQRSNENFNERTRIADAKLTNRPSSHNRKGLLQKSKAVIINDNPFCINQHTSMDVTPSGCTMKDTCAFSRTSDCEQSIMINTGLKSKNYQSRSLAESSCDTASSLQRSCVTSLSSNTNTDATASFTDMSSILNDLSAFANNQDSMSMDSPVLGSIIPHTQNATVATTATSCTSFSNSQFHTKTHSSFGGRFSVLPSVMSNTSHPSGSNECDNISLMSCSSLPGNAQSTSQTGMHYQPFSSFSPNFHENIPSAITSTSRHSGRSSYSSRSRNKRALSNSPLSIEGIDLNTIIRMSPTSLVAYINGSRSSSSCVSPGSLGEKTGCYGHLSARNSSSSPNSGSNSSSNRRSSSYTPQTGTPGNSSNITTDNSNLSNGQHKTEGAKEDFANIADSLLVIQDLEAGIMHPPPGVSSSYNYGNLNNAQAMPEFENLHVLPQDLAAFDTGDYIPFIPSLLPPVHTHLQSQPPPSPGQGHQKPPPSYDQHMARKALLQKAGSSDSSQPSNSSSFESSDGDKTTGCSSGTDTETNRMYACRWLDCAAVFHDQEEFVTHIEKIHIDQKKGDDFVCFWKLCPRRLHPFNARYKLLVHMRIHSGDKPNKCTFSGCKKAFSRLENLKIHLRSHTGERPYSCTHPGCSKTFSNSSDRTKHQKTHQETKPYVCQIPGCDKRYTDPSSLRKHVKKSHPEKKEPDRKKIRGGAEELDPKDLNECLVIQAIKPIPLCDASPPEPTDSGLGRSPRSSQPGSSSDHYPGLIYSTDVLGVSETTHSSCHTSPSSHHSSPRSQIDGDLLPLHNNSLRVPVLPSIAATPLVQQSPAFYNQVLKSPISRNSPSLPRDLIFSSASGSSRSFPSIKMTDRMGQMMGDRMCSNSPHHNQTDSSNRL